MSFLLSNETKRWFLVLSPVVHQERMTLKTDRSHLHRQACILRELTVLGDGAAAACTRNPLIMLLSVERNGSEPLQQLRVYKLASVA